MAVHAAAIALTGTRPLRRLFAGFEEADVESSTRGNGGGDCWWDRVVHAEQSRALIFGIAAKKSARTGQGPPGYCEAAKRPPKAGFRVGTSRRHRRGRG